MGTGCNIQNRARALHHVDVPWRPADLEQREGRIIRQGNQNQEIEILTYVTEGTYDTVMWQKVQAKALVIDQVRRGDTVDSEVESLDGGDIGTAAAETKALATGDPRYLRQVELEDQVKRLVALERAYHESLRRRDWIVSGHERSLPRRRIELQDLEPIAKRAAQLTAEGTAPDIVIAGTHYPDAGAASKAFTAACQQAFDAARNRSSSQLEPIGASIAGIEVVASRDHMNGCLLVRLAAPSRVAEIDRADLAAAVTEGGVKARGVMKRLENIYTHLPRHCESLRLDLERDQAEYDDLVAHPPDPFEHTAALTDRQAELASLTMELKLAAESPEALARAEAARERMAERGRKPGWSLLHNPTPFLVEEYGYPDAATMRDAVKTRERMALLDSLGRDSLPGYPSPGQVEWMRREVEAVQDAGGRSPATVYAPPKPSTVADLSDAARAVVAKIADSDMAVQPLRVSGSDEKAAIIRAVAVTARHSDARVLALPASQAAADYAASHTYANTTATPAEVVKQLSSGAWKPPTGTLLIVDDADHLSAEQLQWLTTNAGATNTKLLLVTADTSTPGPSRALTAALTDTLPWAQQLGGREHTAEDSALTRASRYLAAFADIPDDDAHHEATTLLTRRDTLVNVYRDLAAPIAARAASIGPLSRDTGLSR